MPITRRVLAAIAVAGIVGGCSRNEPSHKTESQAAEPTTAVEPADPKPPVSRRDRLTALAAEDCGRIPLDTVREILQTPALVVDSTRANESVAFCEFTDTAKARVSIHVQRGATRAFFDQARQASFGDKAKDVVGLGDVAYAIAQGNHTTLSVLANGTALVVTGSLDQPKLEALAKKLHELLPPS